MKKLASRKDSRVIDLMIAFGPLGYGIYALLVDYLKERKAFRSMNDIKRIAYELHADADVLRAVIEDFDLFEIEEGIITPKAIERKAQVKSEHSENSEFYEHSELSEPSAPVAAAPKEEVNSPLSVSVATSASKRRERRKRLRAYCL